MKSKNKKPEVPVKIKSLKPIATATWLIENTVLTFEQIADFCGLHFLEVKAIADSEGPQGIFGEDPVFLGQLTREEISRCEKNPASRMQMKDSMYQMLSSENKNSKKIRKYTPLKQRRERNSAIMWIILKHSTISDVAIAKLLRSTKSTVAAIRARNHWDINNITPRDPVLLGICSQKDLNAAVEKAALEKENAKNNINEESGFVPTSIFGVNL